MNCLLFAFFTKTFLRFFVLEGFFFATSSLDCSAVEALTLELSASDWTDDDELVDDELDSTGS
jgi:hypothetical protein